MANQEFDLARTRELQSALSGLTTALWRVERPSADEAAPTGPIGIDKPLRQLLKAAGYPGDVARLVGTLLERAGREPDGEGLRVRDLQPLLEPSPDGSESRAVVQRVLKAAGYPADVARLVLTVLDRFGEPGQAEEALRARDLESLLDALGEEADPRDAVKRVVKAAGYEPDVSRRVLAALEPVEEPGSAPDPEEVAKRALRAAGYPADVVRLLEAFKDDAEPRDAVKRALKAAGYEADVSRRVLAALEPPKEEAEPEPQAAVQRAVRNAGYPADVLRRVMVALEPPHEDADADPQGTARRALRTAGYPAEVIRVVDALGEEPDREGAVRNVLKAAGYPADVARAVLSLLETYGDADHPVEGVRLRDVVGLAGGADDPSAMVEPVTRALRSAGYRPDLVELVSVLLVRFGNPELADSGLRLSDLQSFVQQTGGRLDAREPVGRVLRVAGYTPELIDLVGSLLARNGRPDARGSGLSIQDLADLVAGVDEDLVSIVRHWRDPRSDAREVGHELTSMLVHHGVDLEAARDLAATVTNDPGEGRLKELARVARFAITAEDACISIAEPHWLEEPRFVAAYAEAKGVAAWRRDIKWRVQTLVKLAAAARHLEGDFVECGVDTGGTARAVMAYLGDETFKGRSFYLFDTFRGLVPEQRLPDEPAPVEDRYPDVADIARANFADKAYARIVEGIVPETLTDYTGSKIAFLHIDMNAAYPEVEAFRHFWHLLAPGAPVVFDDYGFPRHRAQRRALDEVAAALDVEIMMLPTCQGIVFKPPHGG